MKYVLSVVSTLLLASCVSHSAMKTPPNPQAPDWFLNEIKTLTEGSGRWLASNDEYKGTDEPYDMYGTEWTASFDGTTMKGRLFAIKDGKEIGPFWEFRQFWHPGRGEAVMQQHGWGGTVGIGPMWPQDGKMKSRQIFYTSDGTESVTGHISYFTADEGHVTESYNVDEDIWTPQRKYIWRRADKTN